LRTGEQGFDFSLHFLVLLVHQRTGLGAKTLHIFHSGLDNLPDLVMLLGTEVQVTAHAVGEILVQLSRIAHDLNEAVAHEYQGAARPQKQTADEN
jgi:uncharacterized protein YoxC